MSKILVTSALPYINSIKHLGNLVGSMLPADVYARFMRQIGHDVLFICATDEHGTPAELGAKEANKDVKEFCKELHGVQEDIYKRFGLSFDYFGNTSSEQNKEITQHFAKKLEENGYIEQRKIKQVYSIDDERFLPDRYIIGTCPYCGYDKARGDQCENCTKLLDPTDLKDARSAVSGSQNLEIKESNHLFLKLPELEGKLSDWIDSKVDWPSVVTGIAKKWLKEGLKERCITRDLKWGVPVDKKGFEDKVFYVWFDAPIGYISATKQWSDEDPQNRDYKDWWRSADDVKYVQFMAKDNVPFHTIIFPATQLGSGEDWKMVDYIKGFNWLTFYGGKFSTSQNRGIFTNQALDEFEADYWRYWLMANAPETGDSSFTFDSFASHVNKDLNDTLGNFINRVLKMTKSKLGEEVPEGGELLEEEKNLAKALDEKIKSFRENMENMNYRKAMADLRAIWVEGNNYLTHAAPWVVIKEDEKRAGTILKTAINLIRIYAHLSACVLPETSKRILKMLDLEDEKPIDLSENAIDMLQNLKSGHKFNVSAPLFRKITKEEVEELTQKYGGEE